MNVSTFRRIRLSLYVVLVGILLVGCRQSTLPVPPTATSQPAEATPSPTPTRTPLPATATPTPTAVPPMMTPTPAVLPTPVQAYYEVQAGDTLLAIALRHDITLEQLCALNGLDPDQPIRVGQRLIVPSKITYVLPEAFLLPDSEVVYGRAYVGWDTKAFVERKGGYLAQYTEGEMSGAEIIDAAAEKYRVGPRVLLAVMEMASGWVTHAEPFSPYPFGVPDDGPPNLSWQTAWAAKQLMRGYYGQLEGRRDWVTLDNGMQARLYPGSNPGTAAVANVLASISPAESFPALLQATEFQDTYRRLFGDVVGGAVLPPDGEQPYLELPFPEQELWYFTGGPHGGYGDDISGWAALDFAPPIPRGCWTAPEPVRSVGWGIVAKSGPGEVWVDMDGDGDIRTGWVIYYLHIASEGKVQEGTIVQPGDVIGYPSCEGGVSEASHLHIARLYDGQWMPALGPIPFQLGNWVVADSDGSSYDGTLLNASAGMKLESCNCRAARKNRFPERPPRGGR